VAALLRRAGSGHATDGRAVTWTVAEGGRGRRWREVVATGEGSVVSSLLLELDPDGRFSHLELSTAAGLLTLHPEADGTLHGNVVTASGINHIRGMPWVADGVIVLAGSAVCQAVAGTGRGIGDLVPVLRIGADLTFARDTIQLTTADVGDGLPVLSGAMSWPLEEADDDGFAGR
jgi:hypothetical protein